MAPTKPAQDSKAKAPMAAPEARQGSSSGGRGARHSYGVKEAKTPLSAAELLAESRKFLEEWMGMPSSEIEAEAREKFEAFELEEKLGREVRDAAEATYKAIRGAIQVASRNRQATHGFHQLVKGLVGPFMKSRHELKRLGWRPERESNSPITRFIEAVDRTNFLGLVDRSATDQEMACLLFILEKVEIAPYLRKSTLLATLKSTVDAVHKCRRDELHGRPALIEWGELESEALFPGAAEFRRRHVKRTYTL